MEATIVSILVQGGLAGVALTALWIVYKLSANHISHNTDIMMKMTGVMERLSTLIEEKVKG